MNSEQLQVPAPAGKAAPQLLTLSTSHCGSKAAKMVLWDDPKDLFYLVAQLFVILSRSSKAINCTEGQHFKAH